MISKISVLKRCNYVFVGFQIEVELFDRIVKNMCKDLRIGLIAGVSAIPSIRNGTFAGLDITTLTSRQTWGSTS